MEITKASAAKVRQQLSPTAVALLRSMFIDKTPFSTDETGVAKMFEAALELIKRNILRADYDIISGRYVAVLQRGGKKLIALLDSERG